VEDAAERGVRLELAGHHEAVAPLPHEVGGAAPAREKSDGVDEDGLPRAGLPGENGQSRTQVEIEVLDDREVSDRETAKHPGKDSPKELDPRT
jgi:hypothetical protein